MLQHSKTTEPAAPSNVDVVRLYYDARCPYSREALAYLTEQAFDPAIIDADKARFTVEQLRHIVHLLGVAPSSLIRRREFLRLGLTVTSNADDLLTMMSAHPILIDRPIVFIDGKARVCRPIDKLYELAER
jgi:arsenate reductase